MKNGAIIQARMNSSRLPGKSVSMLNGKPMIQYLIERLQHCRGLDLIILATSNELSDGPINELGQKMGINIFRGELENVAKRFLGAIDRYKLDYFVRVNGDSPLLDQRLIEKGLALYLHGDYDLVTNVNPRTFSRGESVEVINSRSFERSYSKMKGPEDYEHITQVFYKNHDLFKIKNFISDLPRPEIELAVDTADDKDGCISCYPDIVADMDLPIGMLLLSYQLSLCDPMLGRLHLNKGGYQAILSDDHIHPTIKNTEIPNMCPLTNMQGGIIGRN